MTLRNRATLQAESDTVTNETAVGANTASRVGSLFRDLADSVLIMLGAPSIGQVPTWNGSDYVPGSPVQLSSAAPAVVTKGTSGAGSATTLARSDHAHDISTASAVNSGAANAEGTATSLARSDHTHAVTNLALASQAQGDLAYFNGSAWVRLGAGTSGQFLKTQGASANPVWASVPVSVTGAVNGDPIVFNGTTMVASTTFGTGSGYQKQFIWDADDNAGTFSYLYDFRILGTSILRVNANPQNIGVRNGVSITPASGPGYVQTVSGDLALKGASGKNVVIGTTIALDAKSMVGGLLIAEATTAPTAAPDIGVVFLYADPSDHKVKVWKHGDASPVILD